jgi:putative molybdopterin biosynthesis protein
MLIIVNYKNMEKPTFYKVEEVAEMLQVTKMTIYRYIKAKKIKAYKIGKEIRIDGSDFQDFMESIKI